MKQFGLAGYSGAGKTTLIENLIPRFVARGLRVSMIKHTHHNFDLDKSGKDSFRHREAGATEVMLVCDQRWVLMHELRGDPEPTLEQQIAGLSPCDLLLVEGYKATPIPKLEVHRRENGKPFIWPENDSVVAVATPARSDLPADCPLPWLDLNDYDAVAAFILEKTGL
ncbi:MAG: molybdopterin-guanine dinucleotide biosynthesis protein B [Gammaproteobacteria bacterium]|nr:molybdopterin-guanine dinucleotide biosynthesis protein B [Gammaproteobacteria bacterium]MBU1414236.1 molybdopterin-guanine dinucleotide biosynthesis protein B [Gammaproteobacteria bacterium]